MSSGSTGTTSFRGRIGVAAGRRCWTRGCSIGSTLGSPGGTLGDGRRIRGAAAFGLDGAPWNDEAVLERYEILYEIGAVAEAPLHRDALDGSMALDHRRILATAIGRVRAKIKYRPVVFELLPASFTLWELQRTVEALAGTRLHKSNFRRFVEEGGLVVGTGERRATSGRPAETFRFRSDVIAERPDPGIGIR